MKTPVLACSALLFSIALFDCGESTSTQQAPPVACPPTNKVTMVGDLNYPQQNCAAATAMAEGQLDSLHYRKACQATDPTAALPPGVAAARVTECRTTDGRGVFLDVEVCCAQAVEQALEPESVVRAEGPRCPSWRTRTRANDLHYPDAGSCEAVVPRAEAESGSTGRVASGKRLRRRVCDLRGPAWTRLRDGFDDVDGFSRNIQRCSEELRRR